MSTTVAEKTECACDGRSRERPRAHGERGGDELEGASATGLILTGHTQLAAQKEPASAILPSILSRGGVVCSGLLDWELRYLHVWG